MFGSDFDVMLTTNLITLKQYFDQFNPTVGKIFTDRQMEAMSGSVPREFIGRETVAVADEKRGRALWEACPSAITRWIDRQARSAFLKFTTAKNRFGWVRDLPDIRDYSAQQETLCERHLKSSATRSVSERGPVIRISDHFIQNILFDLCRERCLDFCAECPTKKGSPI